MAFEFWKKKTGPLPNWVWGIVLVGVAVAISSWRRNKAAAAEGDEATSTTGIQLPESVQPTYAFVDADTTNITWPGMPAGGGRPPTTPPGPPTTLPAPLPGPPPKPTPAPPKPPVPTPPGAPKGKYVSVAKWNSKKAPWNSTIWGITNKLLGPKVAWKTVWNAPQNKALRDKRKDPTKIQAGDRVWVPGAK
jgi:hypothetical protein